MDIVAVEADIGVVAAVRSRVDGVEKVYKAGQSWTEKPGAHHQASANASATEPAKILAMLIADSKTKEFVTFDAPPKK
jgi:quercetin dioxygenase-like cupin family protein